MVTKEDAVNAKKEKKYFDQITDSSLESLLSRQKNIPIIEDILDQKISEFLPIQEAKMDGALDFGRKPSKRKIVREILPAIVEDVNSFVGIENVSRPDCKVYNFGNRFGKHVLACAITTAIIPASILLYSTKIPVLQVISGIVGGEALLANILFYGATIAEKSRHFAEYSSVHESINIKKERLTEMISNVAHEYAHHVHKVFLKGNMSIIKVSQFMEGHARGVERQISKMRRDSEKNDAYIYSILDYDVGELKSTYLWLCEKFRISPKNSLIQVATTRDNVEKEYRTYEDRKPTHHALGNSLFLIYESVHGTNMYRDILNKRFEFR